MEYIQLPGSDTSVSRIVFGCWELGGGQWEKESDENNIHAIETAFELGITTFDSAEGYGNGHSEEIVGYALEGKRKDCVIATKVSPEHLNPTDVRKSILQSLKRLRTDYVDIYYVHWPNMDIPLAGTISEFQRLKEEKLIREIGVSNFSMQQLEEAMGYAKIDVIQPEYSLLHRSIEKEILPYCLANQIGIMSYSSIAKGILTGVYHLDNRTIKEMDFRKKRRLFQPEHLESERELILAMKRIAEHHGTSLSEIAISWLLHQEGLTSAIVGTQNVKHLMENVKAVDFQLTDSELALLRDTSKRVLTKIDGLF